MHHQESPLAAVIKGGIAGIVGTAALTLAEERGPALLKQIGIEMPSNGEDDPTKVLAKKVAEGVVETKIHYDTAETAGQAIHWSYGAGWGVAYGIVQSSVRLPTMFSGLMLGSIVGLVAATIVPR